MTDLRPLIFLIFLGCSWGFYFSLLKIAVVSGISYIGIAMLATVGVAVGMCLIAFLRRRKPSFTRQHHVFYLVCALTGYIFPMLLELAAIAHMPAGVMTMIISISPLVTLLIAWLAKTDRINLQRIGGVVVGATSIFLILLPEVHSSENVAWQWLLLVALVPFCYAIHHNFAARYWPGDDDSYQVACGEAIYSGALLLLLSLFFWQWEDVQSWNVGHTAILIMALIALVDIYIYFELIRLKGPIYTSHANYFMIVSGVGWGMLIFAERPSSLVWLSVMLLLVSLYLISDRRIKDDQ